MKYDEAKKATHELVTGEDGFDRLIHEFDHNKRVYFEKVYLPGDLVSFNMLVYPTKGKGRYFRFISHPARPADSAYLPYSYEKASDWTSDLLIISCNVYTQSGKIVDSFDIHPHLSLYKHNVQNNEIITMIKMPHIIRHWIGDLVNFSAYRTIETLKRELTCNSLFCLAH